MTLVEALRAVEASRGVVGTGVPPALLVALYEAGFTRWTGRIYVVSDAGAAFLRQYEETRAIVAAIDGKERPS